MPERELDGLKNEMTKLAEHLESVDTDLDSQTIADILTELVDGRTAEHLISRYGIIDEQGV